MKITIIAMGQRLDNWVNQGIHEYYKRLPPSLLTLIEIPLIKRAKELDVSRILRKEGDTMLQAIPKNDHVVALDVTGTRYDSLQLAHQLQQLQNNSQNLTLLIGGPEGLAPQCQQHAAQRWSLSNLTLPHPLVRLILIEAIYRSWSIISKHPYHK